MVSKIVKIGLGLGLIWYGVLRGAKALVIGVSNFSFRSINLSANTVSLYLNLSIKNPLFVGLKLKGIIGDVYAQGMKVGMVNTVYDYYLSGARTHIIPVIVNLNMNSVGSAVVQNIQSGNINSLTIAFNGKILIGDAQVPIPLDITLDWGDLTND